MAIGTRTLDTQKVTTGAAEVFFFNATTSIDESVGWTDGVTVTWEWDETRVLASSAGSPRRLIKRGIAEERVRATARLLEISTENLARLLPLYVQSTSATVPIFGELATLTGTANISLKRNLILAGSSSVHVVRTDTGVLLDEDTGTYALPNNDGQYIIERGTSPGRIKRISPTSHINGEIPSPTTVSVDYEHTDTNAKVLQGGGAVCAPPQNRRVTFYHIRDEGDGQCGPLLFIMQRAISTSPVSLPFRAGESTVMEINLEGVADPTLPTGTQVWKWVEATGA